MVTADKSHRPFPAVRRRRQDADDADLPVVAINHPNHYPTSLRRQPLSSQAMHFGRDFVVNPNHPIPNKDSERAAYSDVNPVNQILCSQTEYSNRSFIPR
jgi:hypothetical protein